MTEEKPDLKQANVRSLEAFRVIHGKPQKPKRRGLHPTQQIGLMLVFTMTMGLVWWTGLATIITNIIQTFFRGD